MKNMMWKKSLDSKLDTGGKRSVKSKTHNTNYSKWRIERGKKRLEKINRLNFKWLNTPVIGILEK